MKEIIERAETDLDSISRALSAPLTANEIDWFIKANPKDEKDPWSVIVPYVSNQGVIDRLNDVCGLNWSVQYGKPCVDGVNGVINVECFITVYGVTRSHVGSEPMDKKENALKGAYSDALRNCGRMWGIGRELKSFPRVMCKVRPGGGNWWIVDEAHEDIALVSAAIIAKQAIPTGLNNIKVFGYKHGFAKRGNKPAPKPAAPKPAAPEPEEASQAEENKNLKLIEYIDKARQIYCEISGNEFAVDEKWKQASLEHLIAVKEDITNIVGGELINAIYEVWEQEQHLGLVVPTEEACSPLEELKIKDLYKLYKASKARLAGVNPAPEFKYKGVIVANSERFRCSAKQISEMFKLSYEAKINSPGVEAEQIFGCKTQEIHTDAMAAYIDYLKTRIERKAS